MNALSPAYRQDHLIELTRGQTLPFPALHALHVEIILGILEAAYSGLTLDYPSLMAAGSEADLNALMVERLNHLLDIDPLARPLIRAVSRGTETKTYDAQGLESRPDIQLSLTSRSHLFPLIVECKLIDAPNGKTVDLYCRNGLSRFTLGQYAWPNQDAMMVAYVRDSSTIADTLGPFLATALGRTPPEYAVRSLPAGCGSVGQDAARSVHGRYFDYVHPPQHGHKPGDIAVWHLWLRF